MTEKHDATGVLRDMSLLYELSLSVGSSLDLQENCREFLGTLMARKSLDYTAVWVRSELVDSSFEGSLQLVFATPAFRAAAHELPDASAFENLLGGSPFTSVAHDSEGFDSLVAESGIESGVYALYRLGEIGFLKLYSIGREEPFPITELSKLRHVVEQFAISVGGCLDHARVRSEQERRRELEQQVLHTQKLESLGLLAGGIAHDFNNLLSVILGNADLVRTAVPTDFQEPLEQLETATHRAADLCSQLLAYSGRGQRESETFDLSVAVEEMLNLCSVTVSKKARVRANLKSGLPGVEGDRGQVGQVVLNLITNASEALGDEDGDLYVSTGVAEVTAEELAEFRLGDEVQPGSFVFLEVKDTGCGVDSEALDRLFDPFFTTKFTGRGLGLAAVLGIVRSHAGAIRVASWPERGTSARVLFPISDVLLGKPADLILDSRGELIRGTVLIVDDEEPIRVMLQGLLERLGCEVHLAVDGGDALCAYESHRDSLDLVILDYTMPVLNGHEVLLQLRASDPKLPVLMMSGFSDVDPTTELEGPGPTVFLRKPFRRGELERALRACLSSRLPLG